MGMNAPLKEFDQKIIEDVKENSKLLDVYAETEHLRWNAFHFVRGIHKWDISNIEGKISKANDIKYRLRHAALVDFNQLPLIDEKIEQKEKDGKKSNLQDNDRNIISVVSETFERYS